MRNRAFHSVVLGIIFIAALIIRLYPVVKSPEKERYGLGPFGDSFLYHKIAYNLYKGNGFSGTDDGRAYGLGAVKRDLKYIPAITRGPVYPFFMATVYTFLGNSDDMLSQDDWHINWDKVRMVQCVLDAAICIILFFIVRLIYTTSNWPALIVSALYAFNFYNIFYTRALLTETLTTFLLTLSILFCVLGIKDKKLHWWCFTGVGFGLIILSRPEYILFPSVLAIFIFFASRDSIVVAIRRLIVFIISAIVVIAPWIVRNYQLFDKLIIVSTGALGYNLYLGTFEANYSWTGWGKFPDEIFKSRQEKEKVESLYEQHNYLMQIGTIKVMEVDDVFTAFALQRLRDNPLQSFKSWVKKVPRLWFMDYIPIYRDREASSIFFIFYFIFAAYAFFSSKGQAKILMAPIGLLFIYLNLLFLPLHIEPRYGVALIPGIIALTGIGIWKYLLDEKTK